jgi:GT2 family glycosyltransferase
MNNPLISVVIVVWNRKEEVVKAIESVLNQEYKNIEIIIVDNHSIDGTYEELIDKYNNFLNVKIIRTHRNLGCPPARNIGLANTSGEIIFSLDDDAEMAKDCLIKVIDTFLKFPNAAVVACKIIEENSKRKQPEKIKKTNLFIGAGFAIKKEVLKKIGYFPDYFRQGEETYLALKILDNNWDIIYNPECVVYHHKSQKNRVRYDIVYFEFKHVLENIFRLLPLYIAVPVSIYKIFLHFRNYFKNGFILKYPIDVINVFLNGLFKSQIEKEKIKFSTFLKFRKLEKGLI